MKKYKQSVFTLTYLAILISELAVLSSGCKTTDQTTLTATVVHLIARRGTIEAVKYKPEYRDGFVAAKAALDALLALDNPTPDALVAALANIKVKELQGDNGAMAIADVKDLVNLFASKFKNVDVSGFKQIIAALDAGISEGLGLPVPPTAMLTLKTDRVY
jgi:hypothetical protein